MGGVVHKGKWVTKGVYTKGEKPSPNKGEHVVFAVFEICYNNLDLSIHIGAWQV